MTSDSIPLMAFNTGYGHFEFIVLQFGLKNAPAPFMDLRNKVFLNELNILGNAYLDCILVYCKTSEDHLGHLKIILKRFREEELHKKLWKCEFVVNKVECLEHLISEAGILAHQQKVQAVSDWRRPKTKKYVQSFYNWWTVTTDAFHVAPDLLNSFQSWQRISTSMESSKKVSLLLTQTFSYQNFFFNND